MKKYFLLLVLVYHQCTMAQSGISYHNALSAAKDAENFGVARIDDKQKIASLYLLPHHSKVEKSMEKSIEEAKLKPGTYLFPVKNGTVLSFPFPFLDVNNPEEAVALLMRFRQLQKDQETPFIIGDLLNRRDSLRTVALMRLHEIGFFDHPFTKEHGIFFKNFYTRPDLTVFEKRMLLEYFAICNFRSMADVYILALSDPNVAKLSGIIFHRENPELFSSVIKKYIASEKLWKVAIRQSEFFVGDDDFVTRGMNWFDRKNPQENSPDFIPLLFARRRENNRNDAMIKHLLVNSKNTKSYELYRNLSYWLNLSDTKAFKDEIMLFLVNNRKNHYIADGIIYPTMLSALRKSGHPLANRMLLEYLENLKRRENKHLTELVCLLFKRPNQPNPTLDALISELR